ncbi:MULTISPECIES: ribosome maturation factor RimP [Clostridium]|uniref:Ribosome maturation factor RimP n=1 Tax=Clostridium cadaveris TaxID=1529 RepID=A0A1I2JDA7_9CLOT|nr:ribosome maturation factor RimP [Clostridium cadaveris]MDU4952442.1 ribosome maturation factor RimP [Clostridium sp.]MDM8312169.1 ribosome maturation factor RimP [Clostridium cadaveris]NME64128.1 ribosome maturation factor RimP [Clostridium cadaveris]PWL53540.1 MAG: ribosome maturation factor RimP [Clostridium cadaveris]UFH66480.1 ribosome maturation factor RimP [Clostridium cadaveris]
MKKDALISEVRDIAKDIIENLGYELYHVEYTKEDGENYLRIYIDNEVGISLDDCAKVSTVISDKLDEVDPIKDFYYLEISSPGINRFLHTDKHLEDNIGKTVLVKLIKSLNGKKAIKGVLESFDNLSVTISSEEDSIKIDREKVKSINVEEF